MDGGNNNNKDEDEDGYILPMEDYNRLIHTEKFKRYFLDKRFQKVVKEINSADNRREMLQENIKNDKYFSDIVDELLLILGIAGTDEAGNLTVSWKNNIFINHLRTVVKNNIYIRTRINDVFKI